MRIKFKALLQDQRLGLYFVRISQFLYFVGLPSLALWGQKLGPEIKMPYLKLLTSVAMTLMCIGLIHTISISLKDHPIRFACFFLSSALILLAVFVDFHRLLIVACACILLAGLILLAALPRIRQIFNDLGNSYREISKESKL